MYELNVRKEELVSNHHHEKVFFPFDSFHFIYRIVVAVIKGINLIFYD